MKMRSLACLVAAAALLAPLGAQAQDAEFYRGKTIDLYIGYAPGGGYDTYARLVARHLGEFLPGKPRIVPKNMAGGGGRVLAGYIYNVAPKDGTALATADQSLVLQQAIGDPTIQFDVNKFVWIGNPSADNNTAVTWHTTGVKTIDEAKQKEVIVGATGPNTSAQLPQVMNAILGTKFKIVSGYKGGNEMNLAMESGEIGSRGSNPWASWKATKPDWVKDRKINILVQIGLTKADDLPDVPLLIDLATNEEDRGVLRMISAPATIGRPIFGPPGTPPERVKMLRQAFDEMVKSKAFLDEAARERLDINPVAGVELEKIVADIVATPKPVADRFAKIIGESGVK
ncbi:MAG: Tripartite-type tricarboxylate transporter, receptor component TctC [Hyphomicrobiales bacterium]|nr:Tripartite-type tricarboxylate transporter, receptor component TctC [Hyphomicrobiales bacterium]